MMKFISNRFFASWPMLLGLILGLYFMALNVTGLDLMYFPGDMGDARFNMYILEHGHKFLTGQENSLWNAPFMYPEENIITYSDNLIGCVPFYSIFRLLKFDVETSFQFWFILMHILNYLAAYYFLKWVFKNPYAAVIGAFVFAFSLSLQSQITHAQMFPRFLIPLALWMAILFSNKLTPLYFFLSILFVVLQFYCGIYLGFMLTIPIGIIIIGIGISRFSMIRKRIKDLKWLGLMIGSIFFNLFLLLVLMYPYYQRSKLMDANTYASIVDSIPTLRSFLYSQPGSLLWDSLSSVGSDYPASWDHQLFPGLMTLAGFLVAIIVLFFNLKSYSSKSLKLHVNLVLISGLITLVFFLRFQGFSFYRILYSFPGFGSMRSITRIINVELIFFGFALAMLTYVLILKYVKWSNFIFITLLGLLLFDNYFDGDKSYRTKKRVAQNRITALSLKISSLPPGSIISYEPSKLEYPSYYYQLDAMLASQSLNLNTINGYTGSSPKGYNLFWDNLDEASRIDWLETRGIPQENIIVIK